MVTRVTSREPLEGDPIELLAADHDRLRVLLVEYEEDDEDASRGRRAVAEQIFRTLESHFAIEEELLYPALEQQGDGDGPRLIDVAREEHEALTVLMTELRRLRTEDWRFDATFDALIESIEDHIHEEEAGLFPYAKRSLGERTEELARTM